MASGGSISSNFVQIHESNDLLTFYQVCVWPPAGRSRAISSRTTNILFFNVLRSLCVASGGSISSNFDQKLQKSDFQGLYQVCVWPQAGRSQAISSKNRQILILKLFTKSVCGPSRVNLEQFLHFWGLSWLCAMESFWRARGVEMLGTKN